MPPTAGSFARATVFVASLALALAWVLSRDSGHHVLAQSTGYKNFEGPQVHPLTMTPDGTRLLAVNTPNASLSIFYVAGNTLTLMTEIPVGLEPVSVDRFCSFGKRGQSTKPHEATRTEHF